MKSHDIANGPQPGGSSQRQVKKPGNSARFFRDVLTGCAVAAGIGLFMAARAVTKRILASNEPSPPKLDE